MDVLITGVCADVQRLTVDTQLHPVMSSHYTSRGETIVNMALRANHQKQQKEAQNKVHQWLADQSFESGSQPIRPIRNRKQTELGQEYTLCLQKKGRQRHTETKTGTVATAGTPQAMEGELIRSDEAGDVEADQLGMVLQQHTKTAMGTVATAGTPQAMDGELICSDEAGDHGFTTAH